jgi:meso-butanediol dehydrogenase/(S,S)-butanediol dehydrogenase/diacetyl reductase
VNDRNADAATAVTKEIEAGGGEATAVLADVSIREELDSLIHAAISRAGRLDILVNNVAAPLGGLVEETRDETWRTVQSVTLDSTFYGIRAAIPVMAARGGGSIINISSGAALGGEIGLAAYGSAKAAVIQLTQTAAVENAARKIRVNAICPGPIETPPMIAFLEGFPGGREGFERQIPARRIGRPEEIANVALFLASDEASYITGAVIVVDGGITARNASPRTD